MPNLFVWLLAIVILALLVRLVMEYLLKRLLKRTKTQIDDAIIDRIAPPIFWSVFLAGGYSLLTSLQLENLSDGTVRSVVITIAASLWSIALIKVSNLLLAEIGSRYEEGKTLSDAVPFLKTVAALAILAAGTTVVLMAWDIDITPLLASAGVASLAIAFAAKDTISNLFGGISIFIDKPYKVGDYVIIEKQYRGKVTEIGMRSTRVKTRDNIMIAVPNSVMVTKAVINETGMDPKLRIRVPLGIGYKEDLAEVEKLLISVMKKSKLFVDNPTPRVRYRKFSDSAVDLELIGTVSEPIDKGKTTHRLIKLVHKTLGEEGIEIPYPQRDVYIRKTEVGN